MYFRHLAQNSVILSDILSSWREQIKGQEIQHLCEFVCFLERRCWTILPVLFPRPSRQGEARILKGQALLVSRAREPRRYVGLAGD